MSRRSKIPAGINPADDSAPVTIHLDGRRLTVDQLGLTIGQPIQATVDDRVWDNVRQGSERVAKMALGDAPVYGVNTGFGSLCSKRIDSKDLRRLQVNLIRSHAVGVGPPAPPCVVRLMLLLKLHALSHGASGISAAVFQRLVDMLHGDVLPVVPIQGSLGASGDLAPLAHLVLPLLGEGQVMVGGAVRSSSDILKEHGWQPLELGPKEGLALVNGTQFMGSYAVEVCARARRLLRVADLMAALSLEACKGSVRPFDSRLRALRPHRGASESAENILRLTDGSQILVSAAGGGRVQDPYSLRCAAEVHGATRDALRHTLEIVETEINSVSDNPVVLSDGEVISGGLFHGQSLALVLDYLAIALAELASISERRVYLLLSGIADLPPMLIRDSGLNSGLMILQYTAAALVSENKGLCTPASVDSIPTSLGQEDHVSMGARAAVKCRQVLENTETVLAIEQLCAAQAIDFLAPLKPGSGLRAAQTVIRGRIPHADVDRLFGQDIHASLELLRRGLVLAAAEARIGLLV